MLSNLSEVVDFMLVSLPIVDFVLVSLPNLGIMSLAMDCRGANRAILEGKQRWWKRGSEEEQDWRNGGHARDSMPRARAC